MSLSSGMVLQGAIKRHSKLEDLFEKSYRFYFGGIKIYHLKQTLIYPQFHRKLKAF